MQSQSDHMVAPCTLPLKTLFPLHSFNIHHYFSCSSHPIGNLWCYVNSLRRAEPTYVSPAATCIIYTWHCRYHAMASLNPFQNLCINSEVYRDTHTSVVAQWSTGTLLKHKRCILTNYCPQRKKGRSSSLVQQGIFSLCLSDIVFFTKLLHKLMISSDNSVIIISSHMLFKLGIKRIFFFLTHNMSTTALIVCSKTSDPAH